MKKELKNIKTFEQHTDKNLNISDVSDSHINFHIKSNGIQKSAFFFKKETEIGRIYFKEYIKFIYIEWIESIGYGNHILNIFLKDINSYKKIIIADVKKDNNKSLSLFNRKKFKPYNLYDLPTYIKDWYLEEKTTFEHDEDFFEKRIIFLYDYH